MPGNRGRPRSISPRMQPRLHMSTPGVYLVWGGGCGAGGGTPEAEALVGGGTTSGFWDSRDKKAKGPGWAGGRGGPDLAGGGGAG